MNDIVLKDKNGVKNIYSGKTALKIADSKGNFNKFVPEPKGEITITQNGIINVAEYATANVQIPSEEATYYDGAVVIQKQQGVSV